MYEELQDMTVEEAQLHAVLEWLYEHIEDDRLGVKVADIDIDALAAAGVGLDRDGVLALARRGVEQGWLVEHKDQEDMTDPMPPVTLFLEGKRVVEAVRGHRGHRVRRAQGARRALLNYFYGLDHTDATDFEGSATARFYGDPFTDDEIREAGEFLVSEGLVSGQTRADGLLWTGRLTASGKRCVEEHDGDVTAYRGGMPAFTPTANTQIFTGPISGTVNQGNQITSTNTTGIAAAQLKEIFDQLRATLESLNNLDGEGGDWAREEVEGVEYVLGELEEETSKDAPDEEKVRKQANLLRRLSVKMAEGAATKIGGTVAGVELTHLQDQVHQMTRLLGLS